MTQTGMAKPNTKRAGRLCAIVSLLALTPMTGGVAAPAKGPDPTKSSQARERAADAAPVPAEPQQTSASFGDWVVRCERLSSSNGEDAVHAKRVCEAAQSLVIKGQQAPIAQVAFGRPPQDKGNESALTLTVLLPVNIAFDKPPRLGVGTDDADLAALTYRRCLTGGCLADAKLGAELAKALRAAQKPGRLAFTDAAERTITLPVSLRGLSQALDRLAEETTADVGNATAPR